MTSPTPPRPADLPADPAALADLALATAVTAAELVRERRAGSFGIDTKSTATDMVTDVDRASDRLIRQLLLDARPDDGLLTEEDADHAGTSGVVWVADPIDGTTNFVYDLAPYNVSIAAVVDGWPVAAAVVEVRNDERFGAVLGGGSFRNGERLVLADPPPLSRALVATGFGYSPERRTAQAELVARLIGRVRDLRRLGAAAYDLCAVAAGRIDAYFEYGLGPWDLAAGHLIATEAGAAVGGYDGEAPDAAAGVIAAHPDLVGPLRELLVANGALDLPGRTT